MEREPYPAELKSFYAPATSADGTPKRGYLNSGLWMGPAPAVEAMLSALTGARTEQHVRSLWQFYLQWGRRGASKQVPFLFAENDQTQYSGLYLSQLHDAACEKRHGRQGSRGLPWPCFSRWLHTAKAHAPMCSSACNSPPSVRHPLHPWRIGLDHRNLLFESLYHSGDEAAARGRRYRPPPASSAAARRHRPRRTLPPHRPSPESPHLDRPSTGPHSVVGNRVHPRGASARRNHSLVVHLCGGAKVQFEAEWGFPWDTTAGRTPGSFLLETVRRRFTEGEWRAAVGRFGSDVAFLHPSLHRVDSGSTFSEMCGAAL